MITKEYLLVEYVEKNRTAQSLADEHNISVGKMRGLISNYGITKNGVTVKLERNCPQCNKIIKYESRSGYISANTNNNKCYKCSYDQCLGKMDFAGENNPFYGKKHSKQTKEKLKTVDKSYTQTEEFKQTMSKATSGKNNPMYGRSVYDVWVEKYGKERADKKYKELQKKHSDNNKGEGNPMYGKPSPKGSGNGWSGWYKNNYFRSLRELCYMIHLDMNNINWTTGEKISIPYEFYGKRTYRPDFIIDNQMIEIKPIKLHKSPSIMAKKQAGEAYCKQHNMSYQLIDWPIDNDLIDDNIDNIKFLDKYQKKYETYFSHKS